MGNLFKKQTQPLLFHIGIAQQNSTNQIKTTSYNIITFIPLATLIQFKRLANVYFLLTAILQFIPTISPLSPVSAIAPLLFVLLVSLIRAGIEEVGKYRYDRQANSSQFLVYTENSKQISEQSQQNNQSDPEEQIQPSWKLQRSDLLRVGNIIKIKQNQRFPADIILLSTSNIDGKAYIQTSSLDGQKNLKIRCPLSSTQTMYANEQQIHQTHKSKPFLTIEQASQQLYSFNGLLEYTKKIQKPIYSQKHKNQQKISQFIKIGQFLYRDAVLRNTQQIIGVIVGVGHYTKSMMNSIGGRDKMSKLQRKVNFYMIFIFILQFCLILLCGLLEILLFYNTNVGQVFISQVLQQTRRNYVVQAAITSCSYFILLNTMIPISLLVSIQIVKFGQSIFISYDKLMSKKDEKLGMINSKAFRSSINQQLGMVQYVFTDKTGTLTKNQMLLKQIIIANQSYTNQYKPNNKAKSVTKIKDHYYSSKLQQKCANNLQQFGKILTKIRQHHEYIQQDKQILPQNHLLNRSSQQIMNTLMLLIMSTCHECLLVRNKDKQINSQKIIDQYHGSSPDQITLVDSAARIGYKFIDNLYGIIKIEMQDNDGNKNSVLQFKVEDVFQFNSDRKRMSIILSTDLLPMYKILFCKGADSIVDKFLRQVYNKQQKSIQYKCYSKIKQQVTQYSKTGLRTLLFGYKLIPNNQYCSLKQKLIQQSNINTNQKQPQNKNINKQKIIKILQENLELCGATAVEDKLQDQVEQVIQDMIKANIKVCMLTGDKLQTAQNIAKSCRLFKDNWKIVRIGERSSNVDIFRGYCTGRDYIQMQQQYGILIQGAAIGTAIQSIYFSQILQNCSAAVCCRITPKNKAQVVNFAKDHLGKLVLAIGDGANDVPMIQAANIGIGLYGNEGMNAVQASDFAIPQFKCLWRLLFVHGRWNYLRIAQLIKYFFYKNIVFTLGQLWYAYVCSFSGTSIYDATYLVLFNTIFTGGPVIVRALLQQDLNYIQIIQQIEQQSKNKNKYNVSNDLNTYFLNQQQQKDRSQIYKPNIPVSLKLTQKQSPQNNHQNISINNQPSPKKSPTKTILSSSRTITKISIDTTMKQLFPRLYTHSQQQQSLTPTIFFLLILQSIFQSFGIFLSIYFGFKVPQLWLFSICLYSVVLGLVTIRICYDILYWTWLMVCAILFTSIIPYILFIYVMSLFQPFLSGTFTQLFISPNFYLCLGLAIGVGAFIQATFNVLRKYYFPTAVESVRKQWKNIQKQKNNQQQNTKKNRKIIRTKAMQNQYLQILKSSRSMISQSNQSQTKNNNINKTIQIQLKQYKKQSTTQKRYKS